MPVGGKLNLKGGTPWDEEKAARRAKKAKKKLDKAAALAAAEEAVAGAAGEDADAKLKAALPKSYDEEFGLEAAARRAAVVADAAPGAVGPHGHKFRAGPAVLHGYAAPVRGETAGERLDMRVATKADKFCR